MADTPGANSGGERAGSDNGRRYIEESDALSIS
jgi:hypothetical protein